MAMKIFFLSILLILSFSLTSESSRDIININYPPDKTVMEFGLIGVSLTVQKEAADNVRVAVNNMEKIRVIPEKEFSCFSLPLAVGMNRISVTAYKEDKQVDENTINVFRRSDLETVYRNYPADFKKDHFHNNEHPKCTGCHNLEPGPSDRKPVTITAFRAEGPKDAGESPAKTSTCYSCHKGLSLYPFVHAPVAAWSCLSCHEFRAKPVYSVARPDTNICFGCHIELKEKWYAFKYFHGPFNTGQCIICHNPHSSENPYNLVKSTWDLCMTCHTDKGSGEHVIEGYIGTNRHPTRGVPDPLRKGKELTCASCHEPHASDSQKLWRLDVGSGFDLCRKCHTA